ncbi:MAG: SPFH domain-containing protein [Melioribacteraceae bacterium]|nr:SPFH domain-containing protein [Melioribacteraceae bacterium]
MAFIDFVRWAPQGDETIFAYRFPETNLSTYTQLIVQESQEAILFSKGQIIGKFGPGKHTLNTENLPILRNFYGLPFGKNNPFTAEVWFVNKLQPYNIDWTINRMDIHDADYNTGIPLVAEGRYGLRINDAERFLIKIVGTKDSFSQKDLTDQFLGEFTSKTKSTLMQFMLKNKIGLKQISAFLDDISEHLRTIMLPFWENIGFELTKFYLTSVEVDGSTEVGKRVLDAISRQSAQAIGGYTWQQSQTFEVAKDAVNGMSNGEGSGGLLGAVVATNLMGGLGGGLMQPQYNQPNFNQNNQTAQNSSQENSAAIHDVYCSNCSKKFTSNLKFCPHCGDEYCPCPKCGTDNDKRAKKCVSCGQALLQSQVICPNCNSPVASGSGFCGNCGKPVFQGKCTRCGVQLTPSIKFCPKCGQKT